jgi:hypothetical protein
MSDHIFVSYSHQDAPLVDPIVRLLRATRDFVFLDSDSIIPGKPWRRQISGGLHKARLVVVFWCLHSQKSREVAKEYKAAIQAEKDVLPVLLDSTPVPQALSAYEWVDFREFAREQHERASRGFRGFRLAAFVAGAAILGLLLMFSLFTFMTAPKMAEHTLPPPPPYNQPIPAPASSSNIAFSLTVLCLIVLAVLVAVVLHRRKRAEALAHADYRIEELEAPQPASDREQQMADALQEELLRRLRTKTSI